MTLRRSLLVMTAASLVLFAAACSGDDDEAADGPADPSSSTVAEESLTSTTLSDEDYFSQIEATEQALEAAGSDLCAVSQATAMLGMPANPAQVERVIGIYTLTYNAAASALEPEDPTSAEALREAARALADEAAAADYSMEFIGGDAPPEALSTDEFVAATEALEAKYTADCATVPDESSTSDGLPTETTVPEPRG